MMNYQPALGAHFDLGTDALASTGEITDMHDPWIGLHPGHPIAGAPATSIPEGDIAIWADTMQLPGV